MQDNETKKTLVYLLVAGIALLVAWEPWLSASAPTVAKSEVGAKLFPDFKDPLAAKSLEITRFDEKDATLHPFKVEQINGLWSIPSHSNYPADAQKHMADAATALLDVEILNDNISNSPGDHELYGVVAPDPQKLRPGMVGVGMQVTLKDDKKNVLADLIIGKEDKERKELRYVRRANHDKVYRVNLRTSELSTKFEDWIEKDLLKLKSMDVRDVQLADYSIQEGMQRDGRVGLGMIQRGQAKLAYDDSKGAMPEAWRLIEMVQFDEKAEPVARTLADDEELNTEKLNSLTSALDELQIVDVERKPQGLSRDLKADEDFLQSNQAKQSLFERGFYPVPRGPGKVEIFSSEGEVTCTTKDGVRYLLRFGGLAGGAANSDEEAAVKEASNPALNRFLFVMVDFDESQIPKPQFEPMPGEDPAKAPEEAPAEKASETKTGAQENQAEQSPASAPPTTAEPQVKPAEAQIDKPADDKPAETAPATPATPEEEERIAIKRANQRRQEEYDRAVKVGQDKVKELTDRFADWYFIIPDNVYKKIHLGEKEIIKKKQSKEADTGLPDADLDELLKRSGNQ